MPPPFLCSIKLGHLSQFSNNWRYPNPMLWVAGILKCWKNGVIKDEIFFGYIWKIRD